MNPKVDAFIGRAASWPDEMQALRAILLECGLSEEIKWGKPCYSHDGKNIGIMQPMKEFLAFMFFKGALLDDPDGVLESQGENSRSALRVCLRSTADVKRLRGTLKALVDDAIKVEASGAQVAPAPDVVFVDELQERLADDDAFREAFEALTPGRRREYNLYFSDAKQAKTRVDRIEKCAPKILAGRGMRD